jgi:hypothetical protein
MSVYWAAVGCIGSVDASSSALPLRDARHTRTRAIKALTSLGERVTTTTLSAPLARSFLTTDTPCGSPRSAFYTLRFAFNLPRCSQRRSRLRACSMARSGSPQYPAEYCDAVGLFDTTGAIG